MFLPDTNSCAIIFPQENILTYEWNDNFPPQFSVNRTLVLQKHKKSKYITSKIGDVFEFEGISIEV